MTYAESVAAGRALAGPSLSVSRSSTSGGFSGRLESTGYPSVAVGGPDFHYLASGIGLNLNTESYAYPTIAAALQVSSLKHVLIFY